MLAADDAGDTTLQAQPILESADVRMDESRNRPRKIRGEFRLPSSDTGDVVERIKGFLRENAGDLKLSAQLELELIQDISTPARRIVRLQQKVNGVPVHGGIIVVQLDSQEQVKQVTSSSLRNSRALRPMRMMHRR